MKINKRELRRFANPGLNFNPGDGLLLVKNIEHIVRAAVKIIGGKRVLTVYFYNREKLSAGCCEPEYTLFQCRDDYITLHYTDNGGEKWLGACLANLGEKYARFTKNSAFYRHNDEETVTRFCAIDERTGFDALNNLQGAIMAYRLFRRIETRERDIVSKMKSVPAVPHGLNSWVHREILPHYVYYIYKRTKKPMRGYCTACRHDVLVSGIKHCQSGKCPRCGKSVTFKASGRTKHIFDRTTVQVVQKINENELLLRIFKATNTIFDCRSPHTTVWENARFFIRRNEEGRLEISPYYYSYYKGLLTKWHKGERSHFPKYQYSFECDVFGYLYCRNLDKTLAGTPWQYSQLKQFYSIDCEPLEVLPYLRVYNSYPAVEYLVKLGLTQLASQLIYKGKLSVIISDNGKNLREVLGIGAEDLPMFQRLNADANQLELYRELKKQGIHADEQFLIWYRQLDINFMENVLTPLEYTTQTKLIRYINEHFERFKHLKNQNGMRRYEAPNRILAEYADYIEMGEKLKYNFEDSFVLFPRNLHEAHDAASKLTEDKKNEKINRQIKNAYKGLLAQYRFTKDGFALIPPKSAKEIVNEGHALHHCVGNYVERVANGGCVILFIRKSDKIDEPFYTVELRDGKISQTRGQGNGSATPEVKKFLELWERQKLLPAGKAEAA